jgi:hypothetical protein
MRLLFESQHDLPLVILIKTDEWEKDSRASHHEIPVRDRLCLFQHVRSSSFLIPTSSKSIAAIPNEKP